MLCQCWMVSYVDGVREEGMVGERLTLRTVELEVACAVYHSLCLYEEGKA